MPRKTDKRVRLVNAAKELIHKQGFNLTTLADIAQEADVPLGNVYYYFKTKEAIAEAVLVNRACDLHDALLSFEQIQNVKDRLLAYVQSEIDSVEYIIQSGCPIGGLCQELSKQSGSLADGAAKILNDSLLWIEKQLQLLGANNSSRELAHQFVAIIQGHALLTNTFKDPKILAQLKPTLSDFINKVSHAKSVRVEKTTEYA